jgi:hypothetical protein
VNWGLPQPTHTDENRTLRSIFEDRGLRTTLSTLTGQFSFQSTGTYLAPDSNFARDRTVDLNREVQPSGFYTATLHCRTESVSGSVSGSASGHPF